MSVRSSLEKLVQRVRQAHPSAVVRINETGGVLWLDAKIADATVVLEARSERQIGVSAVKQGDTSFGGHDEAFGSIADAGNYFIDQLNAIGTRSRSRTRRDDQPSIPTTLDSSSRGLAVASNEDEDEDEDENDGDEDDRDEDGHDHDHEGDE